MVAAAKYPNLLKIVMGVHEELIKNGCGRSGYSMEFFEIHYSPVSVNDPFFYPYFLTFKANAPAGFLSGQQNCMEVQSFE